MKENKIEKYNGYVPSINCVNCQNKIEKALEGLVTDIDVNISTKVVTYLTDDNEAVLNKLNEINYPVVSKEDTNKNNNKSKLVVGILASTYFIAKMIFTHFLMMDIFIFKSDILDFVIATIVQIVIGKEYISSALSDIKYKTFGMNFLVALSTTIAYLYSFILLIANSKDMLFFEIQVVLLTTIFIGHQIEELIKNKANKELNQLLDNQFEQIFVKVGNEFISKDIEFIKVGEVIRIRPGEKIPLDGKIVKGSTLVNESLLTGEQESVIKAIDDSIISGSTNTANTIEVEVTKNYQNSYLNVLISQIEEVTKSKPKMQKIGDKIIQIFVPAILVISILTFSFWLTKTGDFSYSLYVGLSTLIIACPCALGLATPISFMLGSRQFNKNQLLVRSIDKLLNSNQITTIAFDKTGTLIDKNIIDIKFYNEFDNSILPLIRTIESHSLHPLALMVDNYLSECAYTELENDVIEIKGVGVSYEGYQVGSYKFLNESDKSKVSDYSNIFVTYNEQLVLEFILDYKIRPEAFDALKTLNKNYKTVMITGDQLSNAQKVASELNIKSFHAQVMPEEKIEIIKSLQANGEKVMYIGDGVNDTLAFAQADISVAINNDIEAVKQLSDVILINNDLTNINKIFYISTKIRNNIYQNYFWAFSYNVIAIPLAMSGLLNPMIAGAMMMLSSIVVISNANRLLKI